MEIRKAVPEDCLVLADLMNIAGDGMPAHLWAGKAGPGNDAMQFGARRVARAEGAFSFSNVHVAVLSGVIVGMLLGYRMPDSHDDGQLDELPSTVRPLMELEALIPGSWYINAVSVVYQHRGHGIGYRLMQLAETMARESRTERVALIVAEDNRRARALYKKLGYEVIARRSIVHFPACPHTGDYVLMQKELRKHPAQEQHAADGTRRRRHP